jgi:DNA-binding CsgD family transcriptional regulator
VLPVPGPAERLSIGGILVVAPGGRVQFISQRATRCLKQYFAPCAQRRRLPEPLAKWTAIGDASPRCWEKAGRRLVISLIDRGRKGSRAYLVRETSAATASLTPQEVQVLYWLGMGKTNEQIGLILNRKTNTIKKHVQSILEKLGVENRTAAAWYALDFMPLTKLPSI